MPQRPLDIRPLDIQPIRSQLDIQPLDIQPINQEPIEEPSRGFLSYLMDPIRRRTEGGGFGEIPGAIKDVYTNIFGMPTYNPRDTSSLAGDKLAQLGATIKGTGQGIGEGVLGFSLLDIADLATGGGGKSKIARAILNTAVGGAGIKHLSEGDSLTGIAEIAGAGLGFRGAGAKPKTKTNVIEPEVLPAEVSEITDLIPEQLRLGPAAGQDRLLGLPAVGESSIGANNTFYAGPAGIADTSMQYPHPLGFKLDNIVPDIGAELAAGRRIGDIPFRHPQGKLKPTDKLLEGTIYGPGKSGNVEDLVFGDTTLQYPAGGLVVDPPNINPKEYPFAASIDPDASRSIRPTIQDQVKINTQRDRFTKFIQNDPTLNDKQRTELLTAFDRKQKSDIKNGVFRAFEKIENGGKITGKELNDITSELPKADAKRSLQSEIFNTPRALMSWDITPISSAALRQGLPLIHTGAWWKSWGDMVKAYRSDGAFDEVMKSIQMNPRFKMAQDSGLQITDLINKREENLVATWTEKIKLPGTELGSVRASNRAYTAYLDKLRMDTFNKLVDKVERLGVDTKTDLRATKKIADYVNAATGRGSLGGWFEKNSKELNTLLFSPRMLASRVQMLNPKNYIFDNSGLRTEYWKSLGSVAGFWMTMAGLGKLGGADVSLDPTNSDFGKIKIGDTRFDPAAGFQQEIVLIARELMNVKTNSTTGESIDMGDSYNYWNSPMGVAHSFGANKLNPPMKIAHDWLVNSPFPKQYHELMLPMTVSAIIEAWQNDPDLMPLVAGSNLLMPGLGTQTYGAR